MVEAGFHEEVVGWKGYVEWETDPEKKDRASRILARHPDTAVSLPLCLPRQPRKCFTTLPLLCVRNLTSFVASTRVSIEASTIIESCV
jgi:hypothetical protein